MKQIAGAIDYFNEHNGKITGVVVDYLKLVKSDRRNNVEKLDDIADAMKTIAKEKKVFFVNLSQVPKSLHGEGNLPLGLDAAKDSGEIVNLSDKFLTVWRPNKSVRGAVDDRFTVKVCKDRQGVDSYEIDLEFLGDKNQINSRRLNGNTQVKYIPE